MMVGISIEETVAIVKPTGYKCWNSQYHQQLSEFVDIIVSYKILISHNPRRLGLISCLFPVILALAGNPSLYKERLESQEHWD